MNVTLGPSSGFCAGVQNAIDKAEEALSRANGMPVYCIGELVHNPRQMEVLEEKGLTVVKDIEYVESGSKAIIRAHGVGPQVYEYAKNHDIELIDLTCPNVLKIHDLIEKAVDKQSFIFIIGDKAHPEVMGSIGFAGINYYCIETIEDIENALNKLYTSTLTNLLIITQTTFNIKTYNEIINKLKPKIRPNISVDVKNTICNATSIRQADVKTLSETSDIMVIVGGKNSSNTQKLFEIAKENCKCCYLVDSANELDIKETEGKVGVMAGASTPRFVIDEVIQKIRSL